MWNVVFEDEWMCVIDKPAGIFVHPSGLDPRAPDCRSELEKRYGRMVHNIHRIDRPASGLVLFALNRDVAADLARQYREKLVKKCYLAIVRGHLTGELVVDSPVGPVRSDVRNEVRAYRKGPVREGAREKRRGAVMPALSYLRSLSTGVLNEPVGKFDEGWFSLVEVTIETGRPHQARRHLARSGYPIIGDREHGDSKQNRFVEERFGFRRLALLSYILEFDHPVRNVRLRVCAGIPGWWLGLMENLDLRLPESVGGKAGITEIDVEKLRTVSDT